MYYCDCRSKNGKLRLAEANNGKSALIKTEVDINGKCKYCKYYAFWSQNDIEYSHKYGTRDNMVQANSLNLDRTVLAYILNK